MVYKIYIIFIKKKKRKMNQHKFFFELRYPKKSKILLNTQMSHLISKFLDFSLLFVKTSINKFL